MTTETLTPGAVPVHGSGLGYDEDPHVVLHHTSLDGQRSVRACVDGAPIWSRPIGGADRWDDPYVREITRRAQVAVVIYLTAARLARIEGELAGLDQGWRGTPLAMDRVPDGLGDPRDHWGYLSSRREAWLQGALDSPPAWMSVTMAPYQGGDPSERAAVVATVRRQRAEATRLELEAARGADALASLLRENGLSHGDAQQVLGMAGYGGTARD